MVQEIKSEVFWAGVAEEEHFPMVLEPKQSRRVTARFCKPPVRSPKLTVAFSRSPYILMTYRVVGSDCLGAGARAGTRGWRRLDGRGLLQRPGYGGRVLPGEDVGGLQRHVRQHGAGASGHGSRATEASI